LLASATAHLQPLFPIQPLNTLVVHEMSFLAKLEVDHSDAIARVPLRQRHDSRPKRHVPIRTWHVAQRAGAHPYRRQRPPLAQALVHHVAHLLPTSRCVHHFFRRTSLMTSFSSTCSASSFFNRPFSASSSFRRLASGTLIPPNLLRHR